MFRWLETHAKALQSLAAIVTAALALLALVGVKWQIDATYSAQREQSSRDIYREFLNITIGNPDFAEPDYCALKASPRAAPYEAYVEYLLYAAEQSLDMDPGMKPVFEQHMAVHAGFICAGNGFSGYSAGVADLLASFRSSHCASANPC